MVDMLQDIMKYHTQRNSNIKDVDIEIQICCQELNNKQTLLPIHYNH